MAFSSLLKPSQAFSRAPRSNIRQYRHGIYYHSPEQLEAAKRSLDKEQRRWPSEPVVTECKPAKVFWPAENYHQRYLQKGGQDAKKKAKDAVRCYG